MLPLEGITVVSLEQAVAVPFATRQLADLGARVIKVERPGVGDFARGYDTTVKGLASHFVWLNRSKESLTLNLKEDGAKEVLSRLVRGADVFVQNLAPGAAERLSFGAEELRGEDPRLIHCGISGYGKGGPYAQKKAYDLLVQWVVPGPPAGWSCASSPRGGSGCALSTVPDAYPSPKASRCSRSTRPTRPACGRPAGAPRSSTTARCRLSAGGSSFSRP